MVILFIFIMQTTVTSSNSWQITKADISLVRDTTISALPDSSIGKSRITNSSSNSNNAEAAAWLSLRT